MWAGVRGLRVASAFSFIEFAGEDALEFFDWVRDLGWWGWPEP
jgi:hypothetical protein